MEIIWTILIGFVVGLLARALLPGRQTMGFFITAILGIVGSFVATYLGQAMGWYQVGASAGFVASIVGAIILLAIYGMVVRKT